MPAQLDCATSHGETASKYSSENYLLHFTQFTENIWKIPWRCSGRQKSRITPTVSVAWMAHRLYSSGILSPPSPLPPKNDLKPLAFLRSAKSLKLVPSSRKEGQTIILHPSTSAVRRRMAPFHSHEMRSGAAPFASNDRQSAKNSMGKKIFLPTLLCRSHELDTLT